MENTQPQKLGAGIIAISVIYFITAILGTFGSIILLTQKDTLIKQGVPLTLSTSQIIIGLILQLILVIAIILILFKKSIGVYSYFTITIISIINSIIDSGFQWTIILSLILPLLMAFFINKKRKLFNI
jgi:hypothetical protein